MLKAPKVPDTQKGVCKDYVKKSTLVNRCRKMQANRILKS